MQAFVSVGSQCWQWAETREPVCGGTTNVALQGRRVESGSGSEGRTARRPVAMGFKESRGGSVRARW